MSTIPRYLHPAMQPQADPQAMIVVGNARFTVLTSRVIRLEYDPQGAFEDRASQPFWFRQQPVPAFTQEVVDGRLTLRTPHLALNYTLDQPFSPDSLSIQLLNSGIHWRFGDENKANLRGTARTLDQVSGSTRLEPGLLARDGWTVIDDSATLVFQPDGWLTPRARAEEMQDLYFFGYEHDYQSALNDYFALTGPVPMLPRWALGNWWSRYHDYHDQELISLMEEFQTHEVPLSVCIVDMDWHLTDVAPYNGWTGYTWNRELFPDPESFLARLHEMGLKTALNLHPALGVRPFEAAYPRLAARLGVDPESEESIRFEIANPDFANGYLEELHHPMEEEGVDFWWIDWQQGEQSRMAGLDPLWWLNHLHFYDHGRDGERRPFIFSRWGGLGNHRYPIGFSGDTHVDWPSLGFQPHFTATAANVGFGWWSHDIGGHMFGLEEAELFTRWVQYGVFSPIFRLHSTKGLFHERRPWGWDAETFRVTRDAMQLRHSLIPYLYSLNWRYHTTGEAPIRPMYHDYPDREEAYRCPQQYTFGPDLIAAPFTTPRDETTNMSMQTIWLPPGEWFNFFSGERVGGNRWITVFGDLDDTPVFARAGTIVPLGPRTGWGGIENPAEITVRVFPGAAGAFILYEDDGESTAYKKGAWVTTTIRQTMHEGEPVVDILPPEGAATLLPAGRSYTVQIQKPVDFNRAAHFMQALHAFTLDAKTKHALAYGLQGLLEQPFTLQQFTTQLSQAQFAQLQTILHH